MKRTVKRKAQASKVRDLLGFPMEREIGEMRCGGCNPDNDRGFNDALEICGNLDI